MAFVCNICGSDKVQTLAWIDANTTEYKDDGPGGIEDNWCPNCSEHTKIISQYEYEEGEEE